MKKKKKKKKKNKNKNKYKYKKEEGALVSLEECSDGSSEA